MWKPIFQPTSRCSGRRQLSPTSVGSPLRVWEHARHCPPSSSCLIRRQILVQIDLPCFGWKLVPLCQIRWLKHTYPREKYPCLTAVIKRICLAIGLSVVWIFSFLGICTGFVSSMIYNKIYFLKPQEQSFTLVFLTLLLVCTLLLL